MGLRHERDRTAVQVRDLLGTVLVDDVVVGHRQRIGVAEVDLLLPRPRLALRCLDVDARAVHPVADLPEQRLVVARGEDVVVEDVRNRGREVVVALAVRPCMSVNAMITVSIDPSERSSSSVSTLTSFVEGAGRPAPSDPVTGSDPTPRTVLSRRRRRARTAPRSARAPLRSPAGSAP